MGTRSLGHHETAGVRVNLATRGQSHIRGLVTAGRCFGRSGSAGLETSVAPTTRISTLGVAHSRVAGHSTRCLQQPRGGQGVARVSSCVYHRQRPAPAGHSRAIAAVAVFEFFLRSMNLTHRLCSRRLPSSPRTRTAAGARSNRARREVSAAVVPRGLDQQATDVAVTGLRHPTLGP